MKCPFCGHVADKVVDSRESKEGEAIRRRRQCLKCERRFTSYERIDRIDYRVVKKDGRRERFDREKLLGGILKACEKRAVPVTRLEAIVDRVEHRLHDSPDKEVTTNEIGEFVMSELKGLDQVAYVRFASVYRDFKDANEFVETIRSLLGRHDLTVGSE
ncbi:MAG TPA: transcriptional regulator NrdR [Vicinamibacteria bacterium]|nr:transcriptional regulator NrdR [Vicinamibacteria bacterium]HXV61283.1 transcriptional regulator NrdR [Vicinamibacteria bacterium]